MRPLKSLTFDALRELLSETFKKMPDARSQERIQWKMHDVLMSGFAMLFFQHPSLLQFQERMKKKRGTSNLETIFKVGAAPSESQMREIIDGAPVEPLRELLPEVFERMRRIGWTARFVTEASGQNYYTIALDGSEYFHSTKIECPGCLRRDWGNGQIHYSHAVVAATLVKAGTRSVMPFDVEEVRNEDGEEKQDCEINAGKRVIRRIRQEHRQLSICVTGDDIYSHEPFVKDLRDLRMEFVLVAKPSSHKEMFEWVEELDRMGECIRGQWQEGAASKRRHFEYRIARAVPLSQSGEVTVNFIEVWERDRQGKLLYHNSFITDFEATRENAATIIGIGRSRWKIENEHFNVHKNHGYELEHNYGHGKQTLSMVFYMLNLLAFIAHLILELGDRLYLQCRTGFSRKELWAGLRHMFYLILVDSWAAFLERFLDDDVPASP